MNQRILIAAIAASFVACGNPTSTSLIVATEGGTVEAGTTEVVIPANALAVDTEITIESTPADPELPALEGAVVILRLEPEGTALEIPAAITVTGSEIGAGQTDTIGAWQLLDGVWAPREFSLGASGDVTLSVNVFSPVGITVREAAALGAVTGTISWGSGDPADAAPVQLFQGEVIVAETTTDATGAFSFPDLEPGAYSVRVNYECMIDAPADVTAGTTTTLELTLCG